jgi:hypothetical protein
MAKQVARCVYITDPSKPSRVVVRRGKRSIIRMDGVAHKDDFDQYGDAKIEDDDNDSTRTKDLPFKRTRDHAGLTYSQANRKGKKVMVNRH